MIIKEQKDFYVEQLYTNCLAEAAYYIESDGEAAIVDPLRDIEPYINLAKRRGAKIKYVFETHFHADFVSGHLDLARQTGAKIIYGPKAQADFDIYVAQDGEKFKLGKMEIEVIHTPGHTPESSVFLLYDPDGKPYAMFTGDTLFVGDVGRPDLAVKSDLTERDLAAMLYDSLQKLKQYDDDILVLPAHGPGSACGKAIGQETVSSLGEQKKTNYAMLAENKEEFVNVVVEGLLPPPKYFFYDAKINKTGYDPIDDIVEKNYVFLSVEDFAEEMKKEGVVILDTRSRTEVYKTGIIPGSINIGLDDNFAVWVGGLLDPETPLLVVAPENREREAVIRLARVGFENVLGLLAGGIINWKNHGHPTVPVSAVPPVEVKEYINKGYKVLDVRRLNEYNREHIEGAIHIDVLELWDRMNELDKNEKYLVHCQGGYRACTAITMLLSRGFSSENLANLKGGMGALLEEKAYPVVTGETVA